MQYSFVAAEGSQLSSFAVDFPVPVVLLVTSVVGFRGQPLLSPAQKVDQWFVRRFGEGPPSSLLQCRCP